MITMLMTMAIKIIILALLQSEGMVAGLSSRAIVE